MAAASVHPTATQHLPIFITAPGDTDILMVVTAVVLAVSVIGFGVLFFRLHSLPERMAHKTHKLQFEIVAVLCLISLFTHIHLFWIAGLLLALIEFPDIGGWLGRIAGSVEKIAGVKPGEGAAATPEGASAAPDEAHVDAARSERAEATPPAPIKRKELSRA